MALGFFTLKKGHLIGTKNKTEITIAAAVAFLFCIAALYPFTDTVLFGNGLEASLQKQPGSATMTKFIFCIPSFPPSHIDFRRLTSTSQRKQMLIHRVLTERGKRTSFPRIKLAVMHVGCCSRRERERQVTAGFVTNSWYIWALQLAYGNISAFPPMTGGKMHFCFGCIEPWEPAAAQSRLVRDTGLKNTFCETDPPQTISPSKLSPEEDSSKM